METDSDLKKPQEEREVTKQEFKDLYFKYATPDSGWTEDYWNSLLENEAGKKYLFTPPANPQSTSMFLSSGGDERRMYFLTDESTEEFFDFPGKE